jgi:hypothetical protein
MVCFWKKNKESDEIFGDISIVEMEPSKIVIGVYTN